MWSKKGNIIALFLVGSCMHVTSDTCGQEDEGVHLEDYHGGHSYSSYDFDTVFMSEDSLHYQDSFCTETPSGMIARLVSFEYNEEIVIEINNGQTVVQLIKSDVPDPECEYRLNKRVTDSVNYLIELELSRDEIRVHLRNKYRELYSTDIYNISTCINGKYNTFLHLEKGGMTDEFYFQEVNTNTAKENHIEKPFLYGNFEGCIGDSMINGIPLSKAGNRTQKHDIDESCHHTFGPDCTGICGTTRIRNKANKCACPEDSEVDEYGLCSPSCKCISCENSGTCVLNAGSLKCLCAPGYDGKNCERKIEPCLRIECHSGGSCILQPGGQPSCVCTPGFTGARCENVVPPNPCEGNQCKNNSTCRSNSTLDEGYLCECTVEYDGTFCEHKKRHDEDDEPNHKAIMILIRSVIAILILLAVCAVLQIAFAAILRTYKRGRNKKDSTSTPHSNDDSSLSRL